jgi:hypothetical protein
MSPFVLILLAGVVITTVVQVHIVDYRSRAGQK